jgi:predicted amidohydrolase YtcJ
MERLNKRGILTVIANPSFIDDATVFAKELGERAKRILPTRSMVERGLVSGIGTDGEPAAIWRAIYDAVNHPQPEERLSLEQIVKLASGVERIEDAKHTVKICGPLVKTIFFGGEFDVSGIIEMQNR